MVKTCMYITLLTLFVANAFADGVAPLTQEKPVVVPTAPKDAKRAAKPVSPPAVVKEPATKGAPAAKPSQRPPAVVKEPTPKQKDSKANSKAPAQKPKGKPAFNLDNVVAAVQKHYNNIKAASFDFEQTYKHAFLAVTETSKGKVSYQRAGGKMVWNYLEPADKQKSFYVDGSKITYYSARDKIAYTHDCYEKDTLSASLAFLMGTGNLKEAFTILRTVDAPNPNLMWLTLLPKETSPQVKKLYLGVVADGKVLESLVEDQSGGKNHYKFINFKMYNSIDNKVFTFVPPEGITVQPMPKVDCTGKAPVNAVPAPAAPPPPARPTTRPPAAKKN